jgi:peroxiredoxin Q/BCP
MIDAGDNFPPFELSDQDGKTHTLESLKGSPTILYFYPKDDTSGCTLEACAFRDEMPRFTGAKVFGVSPDGVKSHRKFADKFSLNFPLLADEGHQLAEALGIWVEKTLYGKKYMGVERTTYLLDEEGRIVEVWRKVKPEGHAQEVLAKVQSRFS